MQPGQATIQSTIERALHDIEGARVNVAASGRTDAGVHALAQVAAFSLANPIPAENLRKALNHVLPQSIRIIGIDEVDPQFHPRYDATAKTYEYRIFPGEVCSPFECRYVHHHPYPLDESRMIALAPLLDGEHDFTAFAATDDKDAKGYSKVRRVFSSGMTRENDHLIYRVRGSGFLKHMVRNVVGVLLEGGKGNVDAATLMRRLEPGCGVPAGPTAPACGLFLVSVEYGPRMHSGTHE